MASVPYWVRSYDHEQLPIDVRLDDDFPRSAAMFRLDDPPAFHNILMVSGRSFEHAPKLKLGEATVVHPLEEMGAELQLPVPPLRPVATTQIASPSPTTCPVLSARCVARERSR